MEALGVVGSQDDATLGHPGSPPSFEIPRNAAVSGGMTECISRLTVLPVCLLRDRDLNIKTSFLGINTTPTMTFLEPVTSILQPRGSPIRCPAAAVRRHCHGSLPS